MRNRMPTYAGRVRLVPVEGQQNTFDMERADEPSDEGTPLNKQLLDFAVAANGTTEGTATAYTLDDVFGGFSLIDGAKINFRLHVDSGENATINVNGKGAKPLMINTMTPMYSGVVAGTWITAVYNAAFDCFMVQSASGGVGYASVNYFQASVVPSMWNVDNRGGYSATINVEGIRSTDKPIVDVILTYNVSTNKNIKKAWACIDKVNSGNNTITLWGEASELPTGFDFQIKVVR